MSRNLDRALEVLDVGAQGSDEPSYGYDNPDACARCQGEPPVDGDLCPGCRAFLLGDSDDDPVSGRPAYRPGVTYAPGVEFSGVPIDFDGVEPPLSATLLSVGPLEVSDTPRNAGYTLVDLDGAFQRAVAAEMQRLSTELLNRTLYGNPDGPPAESRLTGLGAIIENEDRSTWLNPPPIPPPIEEMLRRATADPRPDEEEMPYAVSYLTIPDRSRHAATMFAAAQDENLAELRARGWDGLYFHRRMADRRPPGATSTRWTIMTRGLRLGR